MKYHLFYEVEQASGRYFVNNAYDWLLFLA